MWTDNEIRRNFVLYKYQTESHVDSVLLNLAIINAKKSFLIEFYNFLNQPSSCHKNITLETVVRIRIT